MSGLNGVRDVTAVAGTTSRVALVDVSESAARSGSATSARQRGNSRRVPGGFYNTAYIRAYARTIGMEYDVLVTVLEKLRP